MPRYRQHQNAKRWLRYHMKRQHGRCHYCSATLVRGHRWLHPTLDHVVPRSRGGEDACENVVAACKLCNMKKGALMPDEYMAAQPHHVALCIGRE